MLPAETRMTLQSTIGKNRPTVAFVAMIFGALIAFEIFNFSTTDHALTDLLGDLTFLGLVPWSTMLALAFCGIDFAGIARLFTPEQEMSEEPKEVWYLFGAWLLAATMNAILTWWGISMAVSNHTMSSTTVIDPQTLTTIVPVFVAIMVWVIRILIIGTLSLTMDRLIHPGSAQNTPLSSIMHSSHHNTSQASSHSQASRGPRPSAIPASLNTTGFANRPAGQATSAQRAMRTPAIVPVNEDEDIFDPAPRANSRPDPTYHSLSARPPVNNQNNNNTNSRYRR